MSSSSPYSSSPRSQVVTNESPSRYQSRYTERYQSLSDSPPREAIKNSPLRPSYNKEYKIYEGEKYASYEITNKDCGTWREDVAKNEVEEVSIQPSPYRSPIKPKETIEQLEIKQPTKPTKSTLSDLPAYMQATQSFYNKVQSKKDSRQANNVLRPRSHGGISKRVGTSKIPRFQATTSINAIEDIKNEMNPDDIYIPMAARIKLFEKELGNGIKKSTSTVTKQTTTSTKRSESPTPSKPVHKTEIKSVTKSLSTTSTSSISRQRVVESSSTIRQRTTETSVPRYAQQTSQSLIRKKEIEESKNKNNATKSSTSNISKQPKPFRFATEERIKVQPNSFKEKLNLWKAKDKEATIENQKRLYSGIKRKTVEEDTSNNTKQQRLK